MAGKRKPKSFDYITDDTDDTDDFGYGGYLEFDEEQMPNFNNNKNNIEVVQIQSQLKREIGTETKYLILSQFIELMERIAPHITTHDATEMFNRVDCKKEGKIA